MVLVPIGFVSDHMEVVYDLDTEALATAEKLGLPAVRAATAGRRPAVRRDGARPAASSGPRPSAARTRRARRASAACRPCWDRCPAGCCPNPRTPTARRSAVATRDRRPRTPSCSTLALDVAREAAALVRERRRGAASTVAATKTSDVDVVTEADRASEELIRARLLAARPDDAFLGEEGDDDAGTHAACAGSSTRSTAPSTSSTASRSTPSRSPPSVDGEVVAGVVLDVATGVEYTAVVADDGAGGRVPRRRADRGPGRRRRWRSGWSRTGFGYDAESARVQAAGGGPAAAAGPRHPAAGLVRARPVPRRRGHLRRVRRGGRQPLGPRRRRRWSPGAPGPRSSCTRGVGGRDAVVLCARQHGFDGRSGRCRELPGSSPGSGE